MWRHTRRVAASAIAALAGANLVVAEHATDRRPLFRFGVIADIQYCDCEDATNFAKTEMRSYRGTLPQTERAVNMWNSLQHPQVLFVAQLGDLIDGQNYGSYGAGLAFSAPQSAVAFDRVAQILAQCAAPMFHVIGNHELYNFNWDELRERLQRPERGWKAVGDDGFFGFSARVREGWTVIILNAYEVSIMQDESLPGYVEAARVLREYNPNNVADTTQGINFFEGLVGRKMRYVPFNGGLGERQRMWLRKEVVMARERDDRIIVFTHLPLDSDAAATRTLCWDSEEVLKILHDDGCGRVVAVVAGHLHRGGYAVDSEGVHHVTLESPLTHSDCFGYVDVFADRLEMKGHGDLPSRVMPFPPLQKVPKTATPSARL